MRPEQTLAFRVGGNGEPGNNDPAVRGVGDGGANGGGNGGSNAGGGGGATVIYADAALTERVVVAAGGGGGAGACIITHACQGAGGNADHDGADDDPDSEFPARGGRSDGTGGTRGGDPALLDDTSTDGTDGTDGQGGVGGYPNGAGGGGGGGGGYPGGGGGGGGWSWVGGGGGGGGGTSHSAFEPSVERTDGDGNPRVVFTYTDPLRDGILPTVTLNAGPAVRFASPARIRWTGADTESGVDSYDVRHRTATWHTGFGAWATQSATTTTSVTTRLAKGQQHCYQVRVRDRAGNTSAWTAQQCTTLPLDDRSFYASPGWTRVGGATYYGRSAITTRKKGRTLTIKDAPAGRAALVVSKGTQPRPGRGPLQRQGRQAALPGREGEE
ncbi:glycine-rich protein [Nocardioides sp. TF02-7]|uniref:glycine-rich protein n=1 Tax=Nocardioides sp. TF02-7 TaxID=2917724 RepID=UPI0023DC05EE|nr:glycine-rich protein [Nocardioides sp. TF02-7]